MESIYIESKVHESEVYKFFPLLGMIIVAYFYIFKKMQWSKNIKISSYYNCFHNLDERL